MNNWRQFYDEVWGHRKYQQNFPAQPWRWKAEWNDPRGIPPQSKSRGRKACAIGGAIAWGLAVVTAVQWTTMGNGPFPAIPGTPLWMATFVILGITLFYFAWRTPSAKEEKSLPRFIPVSLPLPLQGDVAGMIMIPRRISPTGESRFYLYCRRRELIEIEKSDDDREARYREKVETISDAPEFLVPGEEWQRSLDRAQCVVQVTACGSLPSTTTALRPDHPVIEWLLRCDIPAAEGALHFEFLLPVFGPTGAHRFRTSRLAEVMADPEVQKVIPTVAPPIAAREQDEIFRVVGIVPTPRAGAKGHTALCMDPKTSKAATTLIWLGFPAGILATAVGVGLLLWVPILGWIAAVALIICCGYWIVAGAFRLLTGRKGPETVWVEAAGLCSEDAAGQVLRIPRPEIDRIEVVPVSDLNKDRFLKLLAAGPSTADIPSRKRQVIVGAIRTRKAAQAVGHWISERLPEPHPKVVNTEEGWALVEKVAGWLDKTKS